MACPPVASSGCEEPFLFFNLHEILTTKLLRNYVPVSEKKGALSKMIEFKYFTDMEYLYHKPTLKLYQLVGSFIKPGWYINHGFLWSFFHFSIDYFDLTFTVQHFHVFAGEQRIPVQTKKFPVTLSSLNCELNRFKKIFVREEELLLYHYKHNKIIPNTHDENIPTFESLFHRRLIFWIFPSRKTLRWSNNSTEYPLRDNKCLLLEFEKSKFSVTLKDDLTLLIQCKICMGPNTYNFYKVLSPVLFQPCTDTGPWECTSCRKEPNSIHTIFKNTYYFDVDKNIFISKVNTVFFKTQHEAMSFICRSS